MPQIPIYNRGQGPTVQMTTGTLGPKLSSQAFERAAAAPGEVAARALGDIAKVAADFEVREQKAELEAAERDLMNKADEAADRFVFENNDDNYRAYGINSGNFKTDWLQSNVDTYEGLNNRQRAALSNNIDRRMQLKLQPGKVNAFNRGQARKTDVFNKAAEILVKEMANSQDSPNMLAKYNEELDGLFESAREQGLQVSWTPEGVRFEVQREVINGLMQDETKPLSFFEDLENQILNGEGGYAQNTLDEQQRLAGMLSGHVNELETVAVADATAAGASALAGLTIETNSANRTVALKDGLIAAERLRNLGRAAAATKLEVNLRSTNAALNASDNLMFAPEAEVQAFMSTQKQFLESARPEERVNALAEYQAMQTTMAKRKELIQEDAAGYVYDSYFRKYNRAPTPSQMVEHQRELGIQESIIRPFTKRQFTELSTGMAQADASGKMDLMAQFFGQFEEGEQRSLAMRGARNLGLTASQNIAMSRPGDPRALDLLNAEGVDDKVLKANLKEKGIDATKLGDITSAVDQELEEYQKSIVGDAASGYLDQTSTSGRLNSVFEQKQAIYKLAQTYVVAGMDISQAAKKAAGVITEQFVFEESGDGAVRIPAPQAGASADIMSFLNGKLRQPGFLENESIIPGDAGIAAGTTDEVRAALFASQVRQNGRWHTTDDNKGAVLLDDFGNVVMKKVNMFGERGEFPVYYDFADIEERIRFEKTYYDVYMPEASTEEQIITLFAPDSEDAPADLGDVTEAIGTKAVRARMLEIRQRERER